MSYVKDIGQVLILLLLGLLSIVLPVTLWRPGCDVLASIIEFLVRAMFQTRVLVARHVLKRQKPPSLPAFANRNYLRVYFETRLILMDQNLLQKWKPNIAVTGLANLESAVNDNKGVILLVTPFAYSDLIVKMGLFQVGIAVNHLSHPAHGFSSTRFGRNVLNKIKTRVEDRFLELRVMLKDKDYASAVRQLRRLLLDGKVVSITVGNDAGSTASVPVLGVRIVISTSPLRLSRMTEAPILPVFAVLKDDQNFEVFIESAINRQPGDSTGGEFSAELENFADLFEKYVALDPSQLRGGFTRFK